MTDIDSPTPRSWFTSDDQEVAGEQATLAASAEQALASIAQHYEQATAALQALLDEHAHHSASSGQACLGQPCPDPDPDGVRQGT